MKIIDMLSSGKPTVSFEFFPPKTEEGMKNLMDTVGSLKELSPSFVSMTYGAGGSTRTKTVQLVSDIKHKIGLEAAAHLTCVGHTQSELEGVLGELAQRGIENVLALRGDPPKGQTEFVPTAQGFHHASQLVHLIRRKFTFGIGVAGYPEKHIEAISLEEDLLHLKDKVSAGADFVVTQLFFDNQDYFEFVRRVRALGMMAPVIAGIMPITDFEQTQRFTAMCGAKIPPDLMKKLAEAGGNREKVAAIGIDHATEQCVDLLKRGAAGIHFYTLNKSQATRQIFENLKSARA